MAKNDKINYVVDACALIVYLRKEDGNDKICALLKDKNNQFFMHAVNVGEVYCNSLRLCSKEKAGKIFDDLNLLPINLVWVLNAAFIEIVGKYKTSFKMSYADSFVLALAEQENATVISTDHHEFDVVESAGILPFYWLR
ncbi:MAG: hypothetical protein BWK75_01520 [Candidatus Altiarchaeales archaeon A3]|nr:MAG: hypothetical protein BWK75_01520 [Candidatus Altiarchaeales archaeon A3]